MKLEHLLNPSDERKKKHYINFIILFSKLIKI